MSATPADVPKQPKKGGKKKLIVIALGVLLALGAGGWFSGVIPSLLHGRGKETAEGHSGAATAAEAAPVFVDVPEMIANLNSGGRKAAYIKLRAKLELARKEDIPVVQNAMPRVVDLFQGYLREMRPEELRGTAGTYRLREELIGRTNVAAAPAKVTDVLFVELLAQ